jgi:D-amino-acid dehydrogenase
MPAKRVLAGVTVAVAGGGLIGASAAVRLQDRGARIVLIDPGDARARASFGNAGLVASELADPLSSQETIASAPGRLFAFGGPLDFVWKDAGLWAPWAIRFLAASRRDRFDAGREALEALLMEAAPAWRRLADDLGAPDLVRDTAHWAVWESAATLSRGMPAAKASASRAVRVREAAAQEIAAIARDVSPRFVGGVVFEGSSRLSDPDAAVRALHGRIISAGGEVVTGRVARVPAGGSGVALENGAEIAADLVLVSAGARSSRLVMEHGLVAPLVAERGYHLHYAEHDFAPGLPPLVIEDRFICVVPSGDGVRITGFTEIGSPDAPPDPRKWERLRRHVVELGLPVRGEPSQWMGSRPSLPDFVPAIGRKGRLLYAFGHQHIGVTLAAVTAEAVADLTASEATPARLQPYSLARFA